MERSSIVSVRRLWTPVPVGNTPSTTLLWPGVCKSCQLPRVQARHQSKTETRSYEEEPTMIPQNLPRGIFWRDNAYWIRYADRAGRMHREKVGPFLKKAMAAYNK